MISFDYENQFYAQGFTCGVGIDEAGCGPWAGPLVAAAAYVSEDLPFLSDLNDSKKLTPKKRTEIYNQLIEISLNDPKLVSYGIGVVAPHDLDQMKLGRGLPFAMQQAFTMISQHKNIDFVLIDGIRDPKLSKPTKLIKSGDQLSYSIAAASIIAKVTRDQMMIELDFLHPEYGWKRNAGYGTKQHREAIEKYGLTEYHRYSYAPIQRFFQHFNQHEAA